MSQQLGLMKSRPNLGDGLFLRTRLSTDVETNCSSEFATPIRLLLCALGFLAFSAKSFGEVEPADVFTSNDQLGLFDSDTGKLWLDISYTRSWSIDRATAELPDFEIAQTDEFRQLLLNYGFTLNSSCNPSCDILDHLTLAVDFIDQVWISCSICVGQAFLYDSSGTQGVGLGAVSYQTSAAEVSIYPLEIPTSFSSDMHAIWVYKQLRPSIAEMFDLLYSLTTSSIRGKSLSSLVLSGDSYYAAGDLESACLSLGEYSAKVIKLSTGKRPKLSTETAAELLASSTELQDALLCGYP